MEPQLTIKLKQTFNITLNHNQTKEVSRLFHEIQRRENITEDDLISLLLHDKNIEKANGRGKFFAIKQRLINLRFPITSAVEPIDLNTIFLADLRPMLFNKPRPPENFIPEKIFIEKNARNSYLAKKFMEHFPNTEVEELNHSWEYAQRHKFEIKDLKRPFVFIVKEQWDFIKPCPCTKNHRGCNYWIFNLGFGCPFDCSYCFLQQYANFPGIVLPANLDDFFEQFDTFYKTINQPIRIGTGEFCDSLALDHITGYSQQLINFFRNKPVLFELKTKSSNIANLLRAEPANNIIISWSLNPQSIIDTEEQGAASLQQRLDAAHQMQKKGFSPAFHFDPVIYSPHWQKNYKEVIDLLYCHVKPPFRWISIGTLRGTRNLKSAAEQRFPESTLFYGELFLGADKKLRYPEFMRKEIYSQMQQWIRVYDQKTPLYLCMENQDCWQVMDKKPSSAQDVENYLLGK